MTTQREVKTGFIAFCQQLSRGQTALQVHTANVRSRRSSFAPLKTSQCCLFCIAARPEHVLSCGHSMCDRCVRGFGSAHQTNEHCFEMQYCILCQDRCHLEVRLKPPTAGVRILSVDGGGVRGVIPLETLRILQSLLGNNCLVQDFFDLAFGTSAGKYFQSRLCEYR